MKSADRCSLRAGRLRAGARRSRRNRRRRLQRRAAARGWSAGAGTPALGAEALRLSGARAAALDPARRRGDDGLSARPAQHPSRRQGPGRTPRLRLKPAAKRAWLIAAQSFAVSSASLATQLAPTQATLRMRQVQCGCRPGRDIEP